LHIVVVNRDNGRQRVHIRQQPAVSREDNWVAWYTHRFRRNSTVYTGQRAYYIRLQAAV